MDYVDAILDFLNAAEAVSKAETYRKANDEPAEPENIIFACLADAVCNVAITLQKPNKYDQKRPDLLQRLDALRKAQDEINELKKGST